MDGSNDRRDHDRSEGRIPRKHGRDKEDERDLHELRELDRDACDRNRKLCSPAHSRERKDTQQGNDPQRRVKPGEPRQDLHFPNNDRYEK